MLCSLSVGCEAQQDSLTHAGWCVDWAYVEIHDEITVYSTEMFEHARPFARSQVVVGDVVASREKQRFRLRSSVRLPPEAYRIRRMIRVFDVDSRPVPSGSSCSVSNQPLETMLCSRCAAEASLDRICRFYKPMPTRPSCT